MEKQVVSKSPKRIFSQILFHGSVVKPWQEKEIGLTVEKIVQTSAWVNETTVEIVKLTEESVPVGVKLLWH